MDRLSLSSLPADLTIVAACILVILSHLIYSWLKRAQRRSAYPLPPGPPGEPVLGHFRIVPTSSPEYAYAQWSKEYNSNILYFNILGQDVIVLNSRQAAIDLLDKRGAIYCDRPNFVLFEEMGFSGTLTFLRWGPRFQMHRKILQSSFTKPKIVQYQAFQTTEAHSFARGLMNNPANWEVLLRRYATAIVLGIGFGVTLKSDDDPYIKMAIDASYALGHGGAPAGTPVDFFPFLRYLPNWIVRSSSLRFAREWRWAIRAIHEVPFEEVQERFKAGTATPSFIQTQLEERVAKIERGETSGMTLADIQGAAGAVYAAGQDTTWSTSVVFVLNMLLHPEIQRMAQEEIDSVVGTDRLPAFADRKDMPYLNYILQETLRWCPVSPIGVPHRSLEDDVYCGMFIPKGAFVYANARAMCYDETTYKDPETFNPIRFAPVSEGGNGEPLPMGQFGFGRRVCPGRHLADTTLWILMATMLATVNIEKVIGPDGKPVTPNVSLTPGLTSHPEHFPCKISPRSRIAEELVANTA
ncbi:cytochrome P450 [Fistulina hepatica ATCC 64428]|uniref:Cytochrome P450 n=1 Tax=Fistulina hepatica ATCC 64428 TaxID=1128425 RepID=A0A0D7ANR3_9AGAR|nr:cytochrome P450 [Fistulina hepatica ATCC 64428]